MLSGSSFYNTHSLFLGEGTMMQLPLKQWHEMSEDERCDRILAALQTLVKNTEGIGQLFDFKTFDELRVLTRFLEHMVNDGMIQPRSTTLARNAYPESFWLRYAVWGLPIPSTSSVMRHVKRLFRHAEQRSLGEQEEIVS